LADYADFDILGTSGEEYVDLGSTNHAAQISRAVACHEKPARLRRAADDGPFAPGAAQCERAMMRGTVRSASVGRYFSCWFGGSPDIVSMLGVNEVIASRAPDARPQVMDGADFMTPIERSDT